MNSNKLISFESHMGEIHSVIDNFESIFELYKKKYNQLAELNVFLDLMIERFGEKLDDVTTKESKLFKLTSENYVNLERALKHAEYYIRKHYNDKIKALQVSN